MISHFRKACQEFFFSLIYLYLRVLDAFLRVIDFLVLIPTPRVWLVYARVFICFIKRLPYRPNKFDKALRARAMRQSVDEFIYGETPTVTALFLFRRVGVNHDSVLLDLGCGFCRPLFAAKILGAKVLGIEANHDYVAALEKNLSTIDIEIKQGEAKTANFEDVSHVFVAWTTWSRFTRRELASSMCSLPKGAIILTVTWPLQRMEFQQIFETIRIFSWGFAPVYAYRRT